MKTNYHCHTTFCDGHNSVREMVQEAADKGFNVIGISSHSMYPFASDWHMAPRDHQKYTEEVRSVAEEFKDRLEVLCGFEADYVPGVGEPTMEHFKEFSPAFLVGSVHYVVGDKGFFEADGKPVDVLAGIRSAFGGNEKKAVLTYFALEREMLSKGGFTFLGHPDLIRKQNGKRTLFDENASWYKKELRVTAKEIAKSGVCVEVNTGGIARGYMDTPYPSLEFLSILHEYNVPVTINSDAHDKENLDFWFDEAREYIKKAGYTETAFYTSGSFKFQKI